MKDLHNILVVVTGASSGAGRAIANEFSLTGATLVLAGRRAESLEQVAGECRERGAAVHIHVTDMRNAVDVANLARFALEITGVIDVWINNAGVLAAGKLEEIPEEVNRNVILTNLVGYMNGAQHVIPYFKKQGYGLLFNNISVGGWFPAPFAAAYTASKFGLRGFSESLKGELTKFPDIHVIDLYPAFLDSPGIQHAANYTGKVIMPVPPVYDPRKVAKAIIRLVHKPTGKRTIGASSAFLRLSYALFPTLSRNITAGLIRNYLERAQPIATTPGNVLEPVEYGNGIYGGWSRKFTPSKSTLAITAVAVVGLGMIIGALRREK